MIRVLSVIEADTVTGPVKNLLEFVRQAQALPPESRIELTFATYRRGTLNERDEFLDAARNAGAAVHIIPEAFRFDLRVIAHLVRIAAEVQPDVLQTHSVKSHFLLRLSGLWKHYPWVAFHHGYTRPNRKMEMYNRLDRWSLRKAMRVLTVTRAFERELLQSGVPQDRIIILHNAISSAWGTDVDPDKVRQLHSSLAPRGEKLILAVGRLSQEKAHADLLRALVLLSKARPELKWRLVLVGEGPERLRLEAAAEQMPEHVSFIGQVSDVRPYYAAADVFVLPSHTEGSPNVLLEAMAARIPVVATSVGGIPEIIVSEEHGILVQACQPEALAHAIQRMLESPAEAAATVEKAAARIAEVYSPEARTGKLEKFYQEAVAMGHSHSGRISPNY